MCQSYFAIIRNYRHGMNAKQTFHRKILSRAFKRSFRRNSKSFLKAERRERNSSNDRSMEGANKIGMGNIEIAARSTSFRVRENIIILDKRKKTV